jgi:ABC-type spermidine/putrescine transport system permease subunit I
MFHSFYSQLSIVALVLCCGFAIWKGGLAERAGAVMILAMWVVTLIASAETQSYLPATAFLVSDGVLAVGLLILAIRFSSLWMGVAMLLQALSLSFHAAYFAADQTEISKKVLHFYVLGKNLSSLAMLLVIVIGTIASWRRRARGEIRTRSRADIALQTEAAPTPG